jgi:hypothetical protein
MRQHAVTLSLIAALTVGLAISDAEQDNRGSVGKGHSVQLGPRPFFLVNVMQEGHSRARSSPRIV